MFPFLLNTAARPSLAPDDVAVVSQLYPTAGFAAATGKISGHIYFSDGISAAQGVNVIARLVDDSGTPQNESRRIAVSSVSGYLFTGNAGNVITGSAGSRFGSRDTALIGYYEIPGLQPGTYTLQVEPINSLFLDGSSVGPIGQLGFQLPLPGTCTTEFWNTSESATDNCTDSSTIVIAPGTVMGPNTDIILNGTPPTYDPWEGKLRVPPLPGLAMVEEVRA